MTQLAAFAGLPNDASSSQTAATLAEWNSLSAAIGQTPTMMMTYVDYTQPESTWVSNQTQWEINSFAQGPWGPGQIIPIIAIPMAQQGDSADTDFKEIISGQWDPVIEGIFQSWTNAGYKNIDIRPGHEMNGTWYPWSIDAADASDYVAAFDHIAALAHSFTAANIQVIWSPDNGNYDNVPVANYYPGNQAVDIIGIDEYGAPIGNDSLPESQDTNAADYTLAMAMQMAVSNGKPFALSEVGAGPTDTAFPANLASVVSSFAAKHPLNIAYVGLWDYSGDNLAWSGNAAPAAAWKSAFDEIGGSTPPPPPPVAPTITPLAPKAVGPSLTTAVATTTPGTAGDTLTVTESSSTFGGTLKLQSINGVEEVIYTAPPTIAANETDKVAYTVNDTTNGTSTAGSTSVTLTPPTVTPENLSIILSASQASSRPEFMILLDGKSIDTGTISTSENHTYNFTESLAPGSHSVKIEFISADNPRSPGALIVDQVSLGNQSYLTGPDTLALGKALTTQVTA
jgi:beta-mannanase